MLSLSRSIIIIGDIRVIIKGNIIRGIIHINTIRRPWFIQNIKGKSETTRRAARLACRERVRLTDENDSVGISRLSKMPRFLKFVARVEVVPSFVYGMTAQPSIFYAVHPKGETSVRLPEN